MVVIGLTHPFRGGISHYSTLLVRALRERHEVEFITLRRQYPKLLFPGKTQYDTSARGIVEANERAIDSMNPMTWFRVAGRLNRSNPELIVIQWWHPFFAPAFGTIVRLLRKDLRRRVCFLCHNVLPHESNPLVSVLTRYAFGAVGSFIVHSKEDQRNLERFRPTAAVSRSFHPTYDEFGKEGVLTKEEARRTLAIPQDCRVLLFFGLIRRYKGLNYLIEAMKRVVATLDCRLVIAGEFYDEKAWYLDLIAEHGLEDCIQVVDRYIPNEEVASYFLASDVVVLPYVSATQSGIVQIAFGLETPVITTNVGGLPEAVDDGKTGFVVEPQNPARLAEAILEYYSGEYEDVFRAEIRNQTDRFDWDKEIECIEAFAAEAARVACSES